MAPQGTLIGADTRAKAEYVARFAREYVKQWGDIDFGSFPYGLDSPLNYEDSTDRPWRHRADGYESDYEEDADGA